MYGFFRLPGPSEASFYEITFGRRPVRQEREILDKLGLSTWRPPPLQTGINAKILKIPPGWRRLLIDEIFLYLFAEFELHPSNIFREN